MARTKSTKSVYVKPELWIEAKEKAGSASLSLIVAMLLRLWMDGKIDIALKPIGLDE